MKMTLDLPEDLLDKAMQVSSKKTKNEVIILALKELIRQSTVSDLKNYKGNVDLNIDLSKTRGRRGN